MSHPGLPPPPSLALRSRCFRGSNPSERGAWIRRASFAPNVRWPEQAPGREARVGSLPAAPRLSPAPRRAPATPEHPQVPRGRAGRAARCAGDLTGKDREAPGEKAAGPGRWSRKSRVSPGICLLAKRPRVPGGSARVRAPLPPHSRPGAPAGAHTRPRSTRPTRSARLPGLCPWRCGAPQQTQSGGVGTRRTGGPGSWPPRATHTVSRRLLDGSGAPGRRQPGRGSRRISGS